MKIARYRKVEKFMSFYRNNYGFRLPYQVLIDGTFCVTAKEFKVNIVDQLPKYLGGSVRIVTTQCAILEAEKFGRAVYGALVILKQFKDHKCGHERKPIPAFECLLEMVQKNNSRYIIATQDKTLQKAANQIPGVPILYLYEQTPTLQPPSNTSVCVAQRGTLSRFEVNPFQQEALVVHKRLLGIEEKANAGKPKRKRKGGPNPLSCKKAKGKPLLPLSRVSADDCIKKRKRKRVKLAKHIKEHLKATSSSNHTQE